jgi:outer membrane murein-binding lipoprotein Lpp
MNESGTEKGWWGQNLALFIIAAVAIVLFVVWLSNKSGQDKADLAASVQKLYGQIDCIAPQLNKYADRVDAIGNALARTSQAQADFQNYATSLLTDLDNAVYVPRFAHGGCGCNNGCGTDKFTKETTYTAGATTLVEKDTCRG